MRKTILWSTVVLLCAALVGPAVGGGKTVTLEGSIVCAKCELGEQESCQNVLVVEKKKKKGEPKHYYLTKNEAYESIGEVCKSTTLVRVTGTVQKEDGRLWLAAKEITPLEEEG